MPALAQHWDGGPQKQARGVGHSWGRDWPRKEGSRWVLGMASSSGLHVGGGAGRSFYASGLTPLSPDLDCAPDHDCSSSRALSVKAAALSLPVQSELSFSLNQRVVITMAAPTLYSGCWAHGSKSQESCSDFTTCWSQDLGQLPTVPGLMDPQQGWA